MRGLAILREILVPFSPGGRRGLFSLWVLLPDSLLLLMKPEAPGYVSSGSGFAIEELS